MSRGDEPGKYESASLPDYGALDRLGASRMIFYPRPDRSPPPPGAEDFRTEVAPGVFVASRFHPLDVARPTVLFFHGNGEVVSDYDETATFYHTAGCNLWVVDYRGYGASDGSPTFAALVGDAHPVLDYVRGVLADRGFATHVVVMGRSLGSHPALELAARRAGDLSGLILESGASNLRRMVERFGGTGDSGEAATLLDRHWAKVQSIKLPVLVIHGDEDELIPVHNAVELFDALTAEHKELVIIPGAGHNDILWVGMRQYFEAVARFVAEAAGASEAEFFDIRPDGV